MKASIFYYTLLFCTTFWTACTPQSQPVAQLFPELETAERIMYVHPDSALHILQRMPVPDASNALQQATWALLMTQAKYKNYINQSDSLINIASDYFMNQEDPQRRALVLYHKGALKEENENTEKALKYYIDAVSEAEKTKDYQLLFLIYVRIGNIYVYQKFREFAKENFERALYYAELSKNDYYICDAHKYLAKGYTILDDREKAIEHYQKAIRISEKVPYYNILIPSMTEIAGAYSNIEKYDTALIYAHKSLELKIQNNVQSLEQSYLILGNLYRKINRVDSAYYYLNKSLCSDILLTRLGAYRQLYYLCKDTKNHEQMGEYCDKTWLCQDSVWQMKKDKELIEMQAKYEQQKLLNEKNLLQIEKDNTVRKSLLGALILLCIIAGTIYIYQQKLLKKQSIIQKKEKEILDYTLQISNNEHIISRNRKQIQELTLQMQASRGMQEQMKEQQKNIEDLSLQNEQLKQENQILQTHINEYSASLDQKSKEVSTMNQLRKENQSLHDREKFLCNLLIRKTEVLHRLKTHPKYLNETQWEEIRESIDLLFCNYTTRLKQMLPSLTDSDLQICCLVKLYFSNSDIAAMTGISSSSVSKRKQRLKERIVQESGTMMKTQTLEEWLGEF